MSYQPLAYDDADSTSDMRLDCGAVTVALELPWTDPDLTDKIMGKAIRFEHFPQDLPKPSITVSDAAAALAGKLHLHLN